LRQQDEKNAHFAPLRERRAGIVGGARKHNVKTTRRRFSRAASTPHLNTGEQANRRLAANRRGDVADSMSACASP